jgi:putative hydrolase of the HAD superfamily
MSRTVVFDLGGVVVRICRSWQEACAQANVPWHPRMGEAELMAARKPIAHAYELGELDDDAFYEAISRSCQGLYTPSQVRDVHLAWIIDEYAGVRELIDELHARNISTGVLSNTNASHWRQLTTGPHGPAKFATCQRPRHVHASHLLRLAKPDARIYHAFCQRASVAPRDVIFFDDLEANVQAAQAAGWTSVRIDHQGDTAEQMTRALGELGVI